MKKSVFLFFILIISGGAVFFAGWAELAVPAGSYGVLVSKTHGLRRQVLRGGRFDWVWYRMIPGNAGIETFTLAPRKFDIDTGGNILQPQMLAALKNFETSFDWKLSGSVYFSINPEELPLMVYRNNILAQKELDYYISELADEIKSYTIGRLAMYFSADGGLNAEKNFEEINKTGSLAAMHNELKTVFSSIEEPECRFIVSKQPDFERWGTAKALYDAYIEKEKAVLGNELAAAAERKLGSQLRFEELARYGELLTKYPVLIQYLEIVEKNNTGETR